MGMGSANLARWTVLILNYQTGLGEFGPYLGPLTALDVG